MKRIFLLLTAAIMVSAMFVSNSLAIPVSLQLDTGIDWAGDSDGDDLTGWFSNLTYTVQTTSTIDQFGGITDIGAGIITDLQDLSSATVTDNEGLEASGDNPGYEMTLAWNDLVGQVDFGTSVFTPTYELINSAYTSGNINWYYDTSMNSQFVGTNGGAGNLNFTDGDLLGTMKVTSGNSVLAIFYDANGNVVNYFGGYTLMGQFTNLNDAFLDVDYDLDGNGVFDDLTDLVTLNLVFGAATGNPDFQSGDASLYFDKYTVGGVTTINSQQTGTLTISAVPEPSTFILLGAGIAGLGFYARRRK